LSYSPVSLFSPHMVFLVRLASKFMIFPDSDNSTTCITSLLYAECVSYQSGSISSAQSLLSFVFYFG